MAAVPELASDPRVPAQPSSRPDPAQGVFETMLVLDGRPIERDAHLARLSASLAELFPRHTPPDLGEIDVPVERGPYGPLPTGTSAGGAGDGLSSLRVTVAPDAGDRLVARTSVREVERERVLPTGTVALSSFALTGGLGPHKWADRSLLDAAQARLPAEALPLIVDGDGSVLEASRANVFAVRDGALFTPPTDGRILPGVTRMRVLEIADSAGLRTHESGLSGGDLLAAEEVFLTGSVRGLERVGALDGEALDGGGEVTAHLAAELWRAWTGAELG